jgi:cytoplasmic iron level regulating protein YaaA (DUF328/UPF0246 family)
MLILLPPSETKRSGGVGVSIDRSAIIWAALDDTRDLIIGKLVKLCGNKQAAAKALKLGARNLADIDANLELLTAGTMPAISRYTGVLFDALDFESLSVQAKKMASEQVFIQSALFGLLPATEKIPYYRFSAGSKLPGVNLKQLWTDSHKEVWPRMIGEVLDMRSKAYVELNPVPEDRDSWFVEVLDEKSGKALNHFNKKAKGAFVRSALSNGLNGISEVEAVAQAAGLGARVSDGKVELLVPAGY